MTPRAYLESFLPTRQEVADFLTRRAANGLNPNRGWTYDAVLGWVHADAVHDGDGVGGTRTYYSYEADDGARRVINGRGQAARIHTFGDSFTHCDQVSDGETWQEYLAAHLREPIRNYGVGGYGVYQAYRRLREVAAHSPHRAEYVILNIWEDDHYRNLDSWRRLRFGRKTVCGFTLPHLRVNLQTGSVEERENLAPTADAAYNLCDIEWATATFGDDPVLKLVLASKGDADAELAPVPVSFGLPPNLVSDDATGRELRELHTRAALMATRYVVEQAEAFCRESGRKLMVVLSFGGGRILEALRGEPRFDEPFAAWLGGRGYPVVDMRDAFVAAFAESRLSPEAFLAPYYNGHHTPAGNYFAAQVLIPHLVKWLEPTPEPYAGGSVVQ